MNDKSFFDGEATECRSLVCRSGINSLGSSGLHKS